MSFLQKAFSLTYKIGLARILPGIINFICLFITIKLLGEQQYGYFSVVFGFISLAVMLSYGWIIHGIVPLLSDKKSIEYLYTIALKPSCSISAVFLLPMLPLIFFANEFAAYLFLFIFYGFDLILLELLRASEKLKLYAIASLTRSVTIMLGLVYAFQTFDPSATLCLLIYGLGSFFSILIVMRFDHAINLDLFFKVKKEKNITKLLLKKGSKSNFISLADNFIPTILKALALSNLGTEASSQFSATVDIAKRLIGIIFNLTSFVGMPSIYSSFNKSNDQVFFSELRFLFYYSMTGVFILFLVLLLADHFGFPIGGFNFQSDDIVFFIVSFGIIVQRSRKTLSDPYLIISIPFFQILFGIFLGFLVLVISYLLVGFSSVEVTAVYFLLYSTVIALTFFVITYTKRRVSRKT